ncbi:MAG: ATP-binding protein [Gammaproteobacteria bacterium]|nr:ATP-binding protein [Gammaproteobacteria bacterium]
MDIPSINNNLAQAKINIPGMFPHLDSLKSAPCVFTIHFGLKTLPTEPGILMIRGARQYGKSTWLEQMLYKTVQEFGASSAFYLNGEYLLSADRLEHEISVLLPFFSQKTVVRRLFIDEITAIPNWEVAIKRLADSGKLKEILIITTGSKATDLRRGIEKLPGRKGKLSRTSYLFTPISYKEFHRVCGKKLGNKALITYLISGGSPVACSELLIQGNIPEYVIELTRDWIEGEIFATGRSRISLCNILNTIFRWGGTPVGQAKVAREAGLANNTVALGYLEILNDLGCIIPAYPWDQHKKQLILRKPCKYHFTNLLTAVSYHTSMIRQAEDFLTLPKMTQRIWYEWLIAQELTRRSAICGEEILSPLAFWQNKEHEIDFIINSESFIEVKKGTSSPFEFAWFPHQFPKNKLTVINSSQFKNEFVEGVTIEDFLLSSE